MTKKPAKKKPATQQIVFLVSSAEYREIQSALVAKIAETGATKTLSSYCAELVLGRPSEVKRVGRPRKDSQ